MGEYVIRVAQQSRGRGLVIEGIQMVIGTLRVLFVIITELFAIVWTRRVCRKPQQQRN